MQIPPVLALLASGLALVSAYGFSTVDQSASKATTSGSKDEDRIFGGTEADIKKTPYLVNLRQDDNKHSICGAALIAPEYVLTAAHCILPGQELVAAVGSQFAEGKKDGEHFKVLESHVHPKYNKTSHEWDVAVLRLDGRSKITPIQLCKTDDSDNKEGTMAVVRGWGMTESGVASSTLEELEVRIISNDKCNQQYKNRIKKTMLCAGEGGGKDSCQGDSGGPLVANGVLIGAVSWGGKCGENAGVYARLSMMQDFIKSVVAGRKSAATTSGEAAPSGASAASSAATTSDGKDHAASSTEKRSMDDGGENRSMDEESENRAMTSGNDEPSAASTGSASEAAPAPKPVRKSARKAARSDDKQSSGDSTSADLFKGIPSDVLASLVEIVKKLSRKD